MKMLVQNLYRVPVRLQSILFAFSLILIGQNASGQCTPTVSLANTSYCVGSVLKVISNPVAASIQWKQNGTVVQTNIASWPSAGTTMVGTTGTTGTGSALLNNPDNIYIDAHDTLYIADEANNRVQKWAPGAASGITVAGQSSGVSGNDASHLHAPGSVWVDASGNVYVSDGANFRIQKWARGASSGTTVAGTGAFGTSATQLSNPAGICLDASGRLYVADGGNNRIQRFPAGSTSGTSATTVAGSSSGTSGSSTTLLSNPVSVFVDASGNLYVSDIANYRVQKFPSGSLIGTTVAGTTGSSGSGLSQLGFPQQVFVDGGGNVYVADMSNNRIMRWAPGASSGTVIGATGGFGSGSTNLNFPRGVWIDTIGNLVVSDYNNQRIQKYALVSPTYTTTNNGVYTATVTSFGGCSATTNSITVNPNPIVSLSGSTSCINSLLTVSVNDTPDVIKWQLAGSTVQTNGAVWQANATTVAGSSAGTSGSTSALMNYPTSIYVDANDTVYVGDAANSRVQKWAPGASVGVTVAGGHGNGSAANQLNNVRLGVYVDKNGNVYVTDGNNDRVQKWARGAVTGVTVAGGTGSGYAPNQLFSPTTVYVDDTGNLYVCELANCVSKWAVGATTKKIVAGAGHGVAGSAVNQLSGASAAFVDSNGNVYVADYNNNRIIKFPAGADSTTNGTVVAGGNGIGSAANQLNSPTSVYVDQGGIIYVADFFNHRIQRWIPGDIAGTTVAGTGVSGSGSNQLNRAYFVWMTPARNLYVCDNLNNRVQKFSSSSTVNNTYTVPSSGSYAAVVTNFSGCSTTSNSVSINVAPSISLGASPAVCRGITSALQSYTSTNSPTTYSIRWSPAAITAGFINVTNATLSGGNITLAIPAAAAGNTYSDTVTVAAATGCPSLASVISNVTVYALPHVAIPTIPDTNLCETYYETISDSTTGGTWSSSNPSAVTITAFPALHTLSAGTAVITYTSAADAHGCINYATKTVVGLAGPADPAAISGPSTLCLNATTTVTDATAGGTWSSLTPSIGTVSSSGLVTPLTTGFEIVYYTSAPAANGCTKAVSAGININPYPSSPSSITGASSLCANGTTTLNDATTGGSWTSSNPSFATIGSGTGIVSGVSAGTSTITYTTAANTYGCTNKTTAPVTINAIPTVASITGVSSLCANVTTTLNDATTGGTWTSSNPSFATIGSGTGIVSGVSAGALTITYTTAPNGSGCVNTTTTPFTINAIPSAPSSITGVSSLCANATTTLNDATTGGSWTSSNPSFATIGSGSGIVTGVSSGVLTITYTTAPNGSGCVNTTTTPFTINAIPTTPSSITGVSSLCSNSTTTLNDATTAGSWTSSNPSFATIGSGTGIVSGVSAGALTITYTTAPNGSGCVNTTTTPFTINAIPSAPSSITGVSSLCANATTTLSDATTGGSWTSSNPSFATIGSGTGIVSGVSAGALTITYTTAPNGNGCTNTTTTPFTINAIPSVPSSITGASSLCANATTTLNDATTGGSWTSSNPSFATIGSGSGLVTGISAGALVISYTTAPNGSGCVNTTTTPFTINAIPSAPSSITGVSSLCANATTTLNDATTGGSWTSSNPSFATIGSGTGIVSGVSTGALTISYTTAPNGNGCVNTTTTPFTINAIPSAPSSITGVSSLCVNSTTTLNDATTGGSWTSSNPSFATIGSGTGIVSGVSTGAFTITYTTAPNGNGCVNTTTTPFTINAIPSAPSSITGVGSLCANATTTLNDATTGGSWTSSNPSFATIGSGTGIVSGVSAGALVISYTTAPNGNGCTNTTTKAFTINPLPAVPLAITGSGTVCANAATTLSDATTGGSWTSSNPSFATINSSGVVNGVSAGAITTTYTTAPTGFGCTTYTTMPMTINPIPSIAAITGLPLVGLGGTITLSDAVSGGTWTSGNNSIATVNSSTGLVTGVSNGTALMSYTTTNGFGCTNLATTPVNSLTSNTWTGTNSSDWNTGGNWSGGGIPSAYIDAVIPSGVAHYPDITSGSYTAKKIQVASGATITLEAGASITAKDTVTNNGLINGDGTLILSNNSAQVLAGKGSYNNLQLSNTSGVTIANGSRATIGSSLTMTTGTLTTNDSLVLGSDSSATARIAPLPSGTSIVGNVLVRKYIQGGRRAFRFWGHPFTTDIPLDQIQKYIDITGTGGASNGFTWTVTNAPSTFRYNPLVGNSTMGYDPGWRPFTNTHGTTDSNLFHKYQGIRLFIRGKKGYGLNGYPYIPAPVTIGMSGPVNQGNLTIALTKGADATQDYNQVANPYPSPVDIGTVAYNAWHSGNVVGSAIYIWNPYLGVNGQFEAIPITSGIPYSLEAYTSFQIRAAHNGDTLNFTESNKTSNYASTILRQTKDGVTLSVYDASYNPWDKLEVTFNDDATDAENNNYDALKPSGPAALNFYSLSSDNKKMIIDGRAYQQGKIIPLGINSSYAREFIIKADGLSIPTGRKVYLRDKLKNRYLLLSQGTEYHFEITNEKNTQGNERFELSLGDSATTTAISNDISNVNISPNPASATLSINYEFSDKTEKKVRVVDMLGACVLTKNLGSAERGNTKLEVSALAEGIYILEVESGDKLIKQRFVKE